MTARALAGIDWSRYRLTRARVFILCAILLATAVGVAIAQFSGARNNMLPAGTTVGGDYVAFYAAAHAAAGGDAASTYNAATFEKKLLEVGPPKKRYGLTWQYPPTYFFLILPLAILPF